MTGRAKQLHVALTPLIQARIDGLGDGASTHLKDLLAPEWRGILNKRGLDAIFARYVSRGGLFANLVPEPGNIAGNHFYRRVA
ncbi:MAG: hypothetical protein AAF577_00095 [Pseudomonadota bacterium]